MASWAIASRGAQERANKEGCPIWMWRFRGGWYFDPRYPNTDYHEIESVIEITPGSLCVEDRPEPAVQQEQPC